MAQYANMTREELAEKSEISSRKISNCKYIKREAVKTTAFSVALLVFETVNRSRDSSATKHKLVGFKGVDGNDGSIS